MKNNKKILSSLLYLVMSVLFFYSTSLWAACNDQLFSYGLDSSSSQTFSACGQQLNISSLTPGLSNSAFAGTLTDTTFANGPAIFPGVIQFSVNGQVLFSGNTMSKAQYDALLQGYASVVGLDSAQSVFSSAKQAISATSMASTSASAKVGDTVLHSIISPSIQTRSQQAQQQNRPMQKLIMTFADLKYERANFTNTNDRGNIGGFAASGSYDINKSFSVGAIIPYDHLAFNSFDADRTGTILYVKNTLKLPSNFELSTAVNGSYMYTATQFDGISGTNQLHTYGGGFSTRLKFDHIDSNFIPSAAFLYQYSKDNTNILDNEQHLIKLAPSLGYRVLNNATIQASGSWTKDISQYKQLQNGNDFYDVGVEGAWSISDAWQLRGGYKKILGLTNYTSDSVYLGSAIKF